MEKARMKEIAEQFPKKETLTAAVARSNIFSIPLIAEVFTSLGVVEIVALFLVSSLKVLQYSLFWKLWFFHAFLISGFQNSSRSLDYVFFLLYIIAVSVCKLIHYLYKQTLICSCR